MPRIFRAMIGNNGLPVIGSDPHMLGVRIPIDGQTNRVVDIVPDMHGVVHPYTGGLSVARSVNDLLPHLVPKRLKEFVEGAIGSNNRYIWSMGRGSFSEGGIAHLLMLRPKPERADGRVLGLIEPAKTMSLTEYQLALARTQPQWSVDEPV